MTIREWWAKPWAKNLVFFGILGVLFYTNLGQWVMIQYTQTTLEKPPYAEQTPAGASLYGYDIRMLGPEGDTLQLSSLKGKPVFLNMWASWCVPCLAEFEGLVQLRGKLQDVQFVMLNLEDEGAFSSYLDKTSHPLPFYRLFTPLPRELTTPAIPASFLLNSEGQVIYSFVGAADWNEPGVVNQLNTLLDR